MDRVLLRVSEAAEVCGISRSQAYELAGGTWPVVKIGKAIRIPADELRAWIKAETQRSQASSTALAGGA